MVFDHYVKSIGILDNYFYCLDDDALTRVSKDDLTKAAKEND